MRALVVCAVVLALGGCTALGGGPSRQLDGASARQLLAPGVTSTADVTRLLGDAKVITFDSGYQVWVYDYNPRLPAFTALIPIVGPVLGIMHDTTRDRELVILFDRHGVLRKYRLRES